MAKYQKRQSNLYQPGSNSPFRISRSKIDLFLECPRCFYLNRRLGLARPSMPAFTLNSAVDHLLKKEFDILRRQGQRHKLMEQYGIDALPFEHPELSAWRDDYYKYVGACVLHQPTNLEICGIIDDIWVNKAGEILIVDYKATSTSREISLDDEYKQAYKKQMEVYQWIFKQKGFRVSDTGFFMFANAVRSRPEFDAKLEFNLSIIPYKGNTDWVEPTLLEIKKCLESPAIPPAGPKCEYCAYRRLVGEEEKGAGRFTAGK